MTRITHRGVRNSLSALALGALTCAPAAVASDFPSVVACALKQPIQLEVQEIGTQLGLVFPAQVLSPPGAPPAIPSAGQASVMIANLLVNGQQVGVMSGSCTTVGEASIAPNEPAGEVQMCNQAFSLWALPAPYDKLKGRIVVNGPVNRTAFHGSPDVAGDGTEQVLPVVGGTGAFSAARGALRVRESDFNEHVQIWDLSGLMCL